MVKINNLNYSKLKNIENFNLGGGLIGGLGSDTSPESTTTTNTNPLLVESGIIRKIDVGQDNKFYTLNGQSETFKAQVICSDCNHIQDIDAPFMEWYGKTVAEKLGLKVKDQRLQVHAECPDFNKSSKCPKSN